MIIMLLSSFLNKSQLKVFNKDQDIQQNARFSTYLLHKSVLRFLKIQMFSIEITFEFHLYYYFCDTIKIKKK